MNTCYVDTSVILRVLLRQRGCLPGWGEISGGVTSALSRVEALRTIDRARLDRRLSDEEIVNVRVALKEVFIRLGVVDISSDILDRASQTFPVAIATLDAIHLATAILWREAHDEGLVIATHDRAFGRAARTMGFEVVGLG